MPIKRKHKAGVPLTCICRATINDGKHVCPLQLGIPCDELNSQQPKQRLESARASLVDPIDQAKIERAMRRKARREKRKAAKCQRMK